MLRNDCTRNCWIIAGLIGLAVALFTGAGGNGLVAALFLGFVSAWLLGGLLAWALCSGKVVAWDAGATAPLRGTETSGAAAASATRANAAAPAASAPAASAPAAPRAPIMAPAQPLAGIRTGAVLARPGAPQAPTFTVGEGAAPARPFASTIPQAMPSQTVMAATLAGDGSDFDPLAGFGADEPAETGEAEGDAANPHPVPLMSDDGGPDGAGKPKKDKTAKKAAKDKESKAEKKARKAEKARQRAEAEAMAAALLNVRAHEIRDELGRIDGIGPKLTQWLNANGIWRFDQIAAWTPAEVEDWTRRLGRWGGRITADDWVGQAKVLAAGGETAHSRAFDKGEVT